MSERYVTVNVATGIVENMILWDGNPETWQPDEGYIAIRSDFAQAGWSYVDGVFVAPVVVPEPPTDAEIEARNKSLLKSYTATANAQVSALTNRINTINGGIEIDEALPEEVAELPVRQAQLVEWKRYALYLGRVTKQSGWALTVDWPVQPVEGMDLTVSAAAPGSSST